MAATTAGTLVLADIYKTQNALAARYSPAAAWAMSLATINSVRQFATASNTNLINDISANAPGRLLGRDLHEVSTMSATLAVGQVPIVYGDWSKYRIVDHVGMTRIEYCPVLMDPATGRPNGSRGWLAWSRTGADATDVAAFRALKL